jgi:hypothetical protein
MNKKLLLTISLFTVLFIVLIGCSYEHQTLVTIDGERYTVADFKERVQFAPTDDSLKRVEKIEEYISQMCMVAEARVLKYDEDAVVTTAYETHQKNIVFNAYYQDKVVDKVKVSEPEVRARYEKLVDQYHLAQIVVAEEGTARQIVTELENGKPFDSLLHLSLDTLSEKGDIGFFAVASLPQEILDEVEKTDIGSTTNVIKFGEFFYILKVIERKKAETPTYESVKENLHNAVLREKVAAEAEKFVDKLMEEARVEYNQEGLDIILKPDSLISEADLDVWVVKKYDTSYVRVRTVRDAVLYQYRQSFIDPKQLINRVLIPDLIYDKAVHEFYDKTTKIKRKLHNAMVSLLYQKYYSDEVLEKVAVDSSEVEEYYNTHRDEYQDKEFADVYMIIQSQIRTSKLEDMRNMLFDKLREKYNPDINQEAVARLLKEEE